MSTATDLQYVRVVCISKANPYSGPEGITALGFGGWSLLASQVIALLEAPVPSYVFYTYVNNDAAIVHVVNGRYGKYLRTGRDGTDRNNLLDLPLCL